jgi:hypothetical protein
VNSLTGIKFHPDVPVYGPSGEITNNYSVFLQSKQEAKELVDYVLIDKDLSAKETLDFLVTRIKAFLEY